MEGKVKWIKLMSLTGIVPKRVVKDLLKLNPEIPNVCFQEGRKLSGGLNRSFYIFGPTGSGKTTLAANIMLYRLMEFVPYPDFYLQRMDLTAEGRDPSWVYDPSYKPDFGLKFVSVPKLLLQIRSVFKQGSKEGEMDILEPYMKAKVLVLDDLGVEATSEYTFQTLYLLISERYNEDLQTIITSNLAPDELEAKFSDPRIVSRIVGDYKLVKLGGKDWRLNS